MKFKALLLAAIIGALPFLSCTFFAAVGGSGVVVTENRAIGSFDSVVLKGIGDLEVVPGEVTAVVVEGEDNILPYVQTTVEGGTLVVEIRAEGGPVIVVPTRPLRYRVTAGAVDRVETLGSGNVELRSVSAPNLTVKTTGSGTIRLTSLQVGSLSATISGSGSVEGEGSASNVAVASSGSGNAHLEGVKAENAEITLSGSGDAYLRVSNRLDAKSYGSGRVLYYGNPSVSALVLGSGSVGCLGAY